MKQSFYVYNNGDLKRKDNTLQFTNHDGEKRDIPVERISDIYVMSEMSFNTAFINYISRPDNVIRNMYYVGYTSVIAGGDSDLIFKYADWCYGAEEDEEEVSPYDLSYFFSCAKKTKNKYVLEVPKSQVSRQGSAQYPEQSVLKRSAVMQCFSEEANRRISRMWIRVRCF